MERRDRPTLQQTRHRLRLASSGARARQARLAEIAPIHAPETPMTVSFEGLTPAQQAAALAAFPGGRRFVLAG
ncbi:hypothetical protein [Devosia sp.]|uniref:hypothetical protein n=1 Tax=Devosia sp. TaxID=1871048 RepID=UPI0035AF9094